MTLKNKKCIECGREDLPHFSNKRCYYCARKSYGRPAKTYVKPKNEELDLYFEKHIEKLKIFGKSEESGLKIYNPTRGNICHLLYKSAHKSVASHMDNFVYLTWDEHNRFDDLLFKHDFEKVKEEFPNCWEKVKERLRVIIPLCTEKTRYLNALEKIVSNEEDM